MFPNVVKYFPKLFNLSNEAGKDIKPITKIHYRMILGLYKQTFESIGEWKSSMVDIDDKKILP